MKAFIILLAAAVLFVSAAAESSPLMQDQGLQFSLLSADRTEGMVTLHLHCANEEVWDRAILLFAPRINGQPASFDYGWPAEELLLAPLEQREVSISIFSDQPQEWVDTVSFRVIDAGFISSEVQIDFRTGSAICRPGALLWQDPEASLLDVAVPLTTSGAKPFLFEDHLSPEETADLDYGQLQVCLLVQDGDETRLMPYATIPAQVAHDGTVTAQYSGNAIVCSLAPHLPLRTKEEHAADNCRYTVSDVTLAGPFIFYSTLQLTLTETPGSQTAACTEVMLDCFDTGPLHGTLPLAMFDTIRLAHPIYRVQQEQGVIRHVEADVREHTGSIDAPISFSVVPAGNLGTVVVYFEYFFYSSYDIIRPAMPLSR